MNNREMLIANKKRFTLNVLPKFTQAFKVSKKTFQVSETINTSDSHSW